MLQLSKIAIVGFCFAQIYEKILRTDCFFIKAFCGLYFFQDFWAKEMYIFVLRDIIRR